MRDLLDLIRSFGRDIIKRGVDVFDEQKLKTIASSSRTPNRIRRIAQELWSVRANIDSFSGLDGCQHLGYPEILGNSLLETYPSRCHNAVVGLEYYGVLRDSKLTFNPKAVFQIYSGNMSGGVLSRPCVNHYRRIEY